MASQADIDHQRTLLRTYRRNLAHLLRQAASFGGEGAAPLHTVNSIDDARANIRRIKGILRGWNVQMVDEPDDEPAQAAADSQQSSEQKYPQSPANIPQLKSSDASLFKYDAFISAMFAGLV